MTTNQIITLGCAVMLAGVIFIIGVFRHERNAKLGRYFIIIGEILILMIVGITIGTYYTKEVKPTKSNTTIKINEVNKSNQNITQLEAQLKHTKIKSEYRTIENEIKRNTRKQQILINKASNANQELLRKYIMFIGGIALTAIMLIASVMSPYQLYVKDPAEEKKLYHFTRYQAFEDTNK